MNYVELSILVVCLFLLLYIIFRLRKLGVGGIHISSDANSTSLDNSWMDREKHFIDIIKKAQKGNKYYIARQSFNRLPKSYNLLDTLWSLHKELMDDSQPSLFLRELIRDMHSAVNLYRQNCDIESIEKADSISDDLEKVSAKVMERLESEEITLLEKQLSNLEKSIRVFSKNSEDKQSIKDVEEIDGSMNKDLLKSNARLQARYQQATDSLVSIFANTKDNVEDIEAKEKQYNLRAIRDHKKALEMFDEDTGLLLDNNFKKGVGLEQLVVLLGGWDNRHLLASTMSYNNTIYGTIFSKLKKEAQLSITEMMVHEKKKEI